jgi:hypothetical protein
MAIVDLVFVNSYLGIVDTSQDVKISALIPLVEQTYLDIRHAPFDVDSEEATVYPIGSDVTATEMIGFKLAKRDDGRLLKSEKIDGYSMTLEGYLGSKYGYPTDILSAIKRFIDAR